MTCSRLPTAVAGDPASSHSDLTPRQAVRRVRIARNRPGRRRHPQPREGGAHFAFRVATRWTHLRHGADCPTRPLPARACIRCTLGDFFKRAVQPFAHRRPTSRSRRPGGIPDAVVRRHRLFVVWATEFSPARIVRLVACRASPWRVGRTETRLGHAPKRATSRPMLQTRNPGGGHSRAGGRSGNGFKIRWHPTLSRCIGVPVLDGEHDRERDTHGVAWEREARRSGPLLLRYR